MSDTRTITLSVNGVAYTREVETRVHLADFLRHSLNLTGTHVGCEHGVCGACTVQVDDVALRSCLILAVQCDGKSVKTLEGMAEADGKLHPIQTAFSDCHALQCGFCTPGMIMSIDAYLRENPFPTEEEIRDLLSGNICRCTGYQGIVEAALQAAEEIRKGTAA